MMRATLGVIGVTGAMAFGFIHVPSWFTVTYENPQPFFAEAIPQSTSDESQSDIDQADERPVIYHVPLPKQVKAIYMTSCVVGTPSFRERLIALMEETEINSVMIDIKDYSGTISFPSSLSAWLPAWQETRCGARDMRDFIARLHKKNIFVIGRITVFQDPFYAFRNPHLAVMRADTGEVWTDHKGLAFIDVAAEEYWDHIIALAVESYSIGFDELNFDYVRYPSDGNMQIAQYPHTERSSYPADKQSNLEAFFAYLAKHMQDETLFTAVRHVNTGRASSTPWTSVDLFGMTTTNFDDLSIGQIQERAMPYFDFVAPMVYPSHYPHDYLGLGNPNHHPYAIVNHAMKSAVARAQASTTPVAGFLHERIGTSTPALYQKPVYGADRLRTWIQDFDYGGEYGPKEVRAQIQASYDAGVMSWMVWAPSNLYTRDALLPPGTYEVEERSDIVDEESEFSE